MPSCYRSPREEQIGIFTPYRSPRQEMVPLDVYYSPRQELINLTTSAFNSPRQEMVRIWEPASRYYQNYILQQEYEGQIVDWFEFKLYGPGGVKDLSDFIVGNMTYEDPRGGKKSLTLNLAAYDDNDEVIDPSPFGPNLESGDEYYNWIKAHNIEDQGSSYAVFRCSVDGEIFETPRMLLSDPQFLDGICTLTLTDFTELLEIENQSLGDILGDEGDRVTAHANVHECCSEYGIRDVDLEFTNYLIRELRRTEGSPLQWIDASVRPYGGRRSFIPPNRFLIKPLKYPDTTVFEFVDEINIKKFTFRENSQDLRNKFDSTRLAPENSTVGEYPWKYGGDLLGRNGQTEYSFERPVAVAFSQYEVTPGGGDLIHWAWFNGEEILPQNSHVFVMTNKPATKVVWTYIPSLPWRAATPPGFHITWLGAFFSNKKAFPYDEDFTATYGGHLGDPTRQKWGLRPEYSNIEDPIIPNRAVAQAYCESMWWENIINTNMGQLEAEFIPGIKSGDCVRVTYRSYRLDRARFIVDKFTLAIDFVAASATMSLGLIKPEGMQ